MGCDWSVCGFGTYCGIGSGITGFTGFTSPCDIGGVLGLTGFTGFTGFTGILSTLCAWFDINDCINGVIKSVAASVRGLTGCLSLIP